MGFSRKRIGRDGKPRYTAYYLDIRGQERSAGTFSNKKDANDAWKKAEAGVSAGRQGDPGRGRQTFQVYVMEKWLPHHLLEPGVRSNYAGQIRKHLIPFFGPMKMRDILPEHVRQWVTYMQDKSASARTIQYCKGSILNAIFTTALEDEAVTIHPSRGVKTPPVPDKPRHIITADQFDLLYQALPDTDAQLLVETAIEWTGIGRQLRALILSPVVRQRLTMYISAHRRADLEELRRHIEAGHVTPVVCEPQSRSCSAVSSARRPTARP